MFSFLFFSCELVPIDLFVCYTEEMVAHMVILIASGLSRTFAMRARGL